jgi:hypothetical protein
LFVVVLCFAYAIEFIQFVHMPMAELVTVIDLVVSIPAYVIFWAFVFEKKVFSQPFLKMYTILYLLWEIAVHVFIYPYIYEISLAISLPDLILYTPEYIGVLLYSFKKKGVV